MYGRCGIRSLLLPEYIWLATGGKSQFNDRLMVLKGRKVTAFPDIDGYDEWRKKAKNYPMLDITISDILERNATPEQRERQVDIRCLDACIRSGGNAEGEVTVFEKGLSS